MVEFAIGEFDSGSSPPLGLLGARAFGLQALASSATAHSTTTDGSRIILLDPFAFRRPDAEQVSCGFPPTREVRGHPLVRSR